MTSDPVAQQPGPSRIAYVLSRFPHLPETFIVREMDAVQRAGVQILAHALIRQQQPVVHAIAARWLPQVRFVPHIGVEVLRSNLRTFRGRPWAYLGVWLSVASGYRADPRSLVRALVLLPGIFVFTERVRDEGAHHVHAHYATYPLLAAWVVHRLLGLPYSVTVHAHDLFMSAAMLRTKLAGAEVIVSISEYNRDYLVRHVDSTLASRIVVLHCGVDIGRYDLPPAPRTGVLQLLSVGSLQPYKGHEHLLTACHLLKTRGVPFRCQIIGGGQQRRALEAQIERLGLQEHVFLLGPRSEAEVAEYLRDAHCYVQPSVVASSGQMEGIPVALMEAMAAGLPVVATALSGVPELVRPRETGWLVRPADPDALADAVQDIHEHPDRAATVAGAGRALVKAEFDLAVNADRLAALLDASASRSLPDRAM